MKHVSESSQQALQQIASLNSFKWPRNPKQPCLLIYWLIDWCQLRNIIQIHNSVLWDGKYSIEHSCIFPTSSLDVGEYLCGIVLVPCHIAMNLSNVMFEATGWRGRTYLSFCNLSFLKNAPSLLFIICQVSFDKWILSQVGGLEKLPLRFPQHALWVDSSPQLNIYIWMVWLKEHILQRHVFIKDRNVCSKYDNHSRLNNLHKWLGGVYDHLMGFLAFHLKNLYNRCMVHLTSTRNLHFNNKNRFSYMLQTLWRKWLWPKFGFA